jgi:hypothetical protein
MNIEKIKKLASSMKLDSDKGLKNQECVSGTKYV